MTQAGQTVFNDPLKREQMAAFFVNLPPAWLAWIPVAAPTTGGASMQGMSHTVRMMASQFVKGYIKTDKNDAADAQAICEAVTRPSMRFVPIKNMERQGVLASRRMRQGFVKARTSQANQIRGPMASSG